MEKLAHVKPGYDAWFAENSSGGAFARWDNTPVVVEEFDSSDNAYQCHALYNPGMGARIPAAFLELSTIQRQEA